MSSDKYKQKFLNSNDLIIFLCSFLIFFQRNYIFISHTKLLYMATNIKTIHTVPRYIIDLDLPPEERWNQIVDDYKGI